MTELLRKTNVLYNINKVIKQSFIWNVYGRSCELQPSLLFLDGRQRG